MIPQPRCPHCRHFVYLNALSCPNCSAELGSHVLTRQFHGAPRGRAVIDGQTWYTCSNRESYCNCNWLVWEDGPAGRCFACRLTRRGPDSDDTIALEKLAKTEEAKRRLILRPRVSTTIARRCGCGSASRTARCRAACAMRSGTTTRGHRHHLDAAATNVRDTDVDPLVSDRDQPVQRLLSDWGQMSQAFNRINRAMGFGDLYPFQLPAPVRAKLEFMHDMVTHAPLTVDEQITRAQIARALPVTP